jgi:hypothetical protein
MMTGAGVLFLLVTIPPTKIPDRLAKNLQNIRQATQLGPVGSFSAVTNKESAGLANNVDLITLEWWLYGLGIRNSGAVTAGQLVVMAALGAWILWSTRRGSGMSRAAEVSIVACYSMLFLYHRLYDTVLLAFPLVYAALRGRSVPGAPKWMYRGAALCLLAVMHLRLNLLIHFLPLAETRSFVGRMVSALLIPCGIWLILSALFLLVAAERRSSPPRPEPAPGA